MKVGDHVRHIAFEIDGVIKSINPTTAFVLWRNDVGTEVAITSLQPAQGKGADEVKP